MAPGEPNRLVPARRRERQGRGRSPGRSARPGTRRCGPARGGHREATSISHFLAVLGPCGIDARLGGLVTPGRKAAPAGAGAGRARDQRIRRRHGGTGLYVCITDLEDELIRAAGTGAVEQIIQAQGELRPSGSSSSSPRSGSAARQSSCTGSWAPGQAARVSTLGCWQPRSIRPIPRPLNRTLAHA
jgi:hypothetical protein